MNERALTSQGIPLGSDISWQRSSDDPIVILNEDNDSSSDYTFEEQDKNRGSLNIPLTPVADSDARYYNCHKSDTSNASSPSSNNLWSTPGKQTCRFKDENRKSLTPDPVTGGDKQNPWIGQEAEADDNEEDHKKHSGDGDKKTTPLLGSTKERRPSAEGKSASKYCVKRRRRSSPNRDEAVRNQDAIYAVQGPDFDPQANGNSPESKDVKPDICNATITHGPTRGTATSSPALEQVQGQGDVTKVEEPEWGITKILDKKETVSGTEYMVRWENTWLRKGELGNARELLREFEAKVRVPRGRKRGRPACADKVW